MWKLFKRVFLGFALVIFVAIASLMVFLQTDYARKKVAEIGLSFANDILESKITVGKLSGNLYNHIQLTDVAMSLDSVEIAQIPSINVYYSALKLLTLEVFVDSVIIENATLNPNTYADSTWNFAHIYVGPDSVVTKIDTLKTSIKVNINQIHLRNFTIKSQNCYSVVPKQIDSINIDGAFRWSTDKWGVYVEQLALNAHNPSLGIKSLKFELVSHNDSLALTDFTLHTTKNFIESDAFYSNILSYGADMVGHKIDADELLFILPNIKLAHKPQLTFNVNSNNERILANANAKMGVENISVSLLLGHRDSLGLSIATNEARVVLSNLIPNHWGVPVDSSLLLSGTILAKSKGSTNLLDTVYISAQLDSSAYKIPSLTKFTLTKCSVNGYLINKEARFRGQFNLPQGDLVASGDVNEIGTNNSVALSAIFSNLKLEKTLPKLTFSTSLNGEIIANGSFPASSPFILKSNILFSKSMSDKVEIDSAKANVIIRNDSILISQFNMNIPSVEINASGYSTTSGLWAFEGNANGFVNDVVGRYLSITLPRGKVRIDAAVSGVLAKIKGSASGQIDSLVMDSTTISKVIFASKFTYDKVLELDSIILNAKDFSGYGAHFDTIRVDGFYRDQAVHTNAYLADSTLIAIELSALTRFEPNISSNIDLLKITTPYSKYYNSTNGIEFVYSKNTLEIKGLNIKDQENDDFALEANGIIGLRGDENFVVKIHSFNLAFLSDYKLISTPIQGALSCDVSLLGNSQSPSITATLNVDALKYKTFMIEEIKSDFKAENNIATTNIKIVSQEKDSVMFTAEAPLTLRFDTSAVHFNLPGNINGRTWSKDIDLTNLNSTDRNSAKFGGFLSFELAFNGLYNALVYKGKLELKEGFVTDARSGIQYKDILGRVSVDSNSVTLDTLSIHEKDGFLGASGWAKFDTSFVGGELIKADINLTAKNFAVVQSKKAEIILNADFNLKSEKNFPVFSGDIRVVRSSFFIPAFLETDYSAVADKTPLLVKAQEQAIKNVKDSIVGNIEADTVANVYVAKFMENLTGSLKLVIPKNTWLKSETSKIELNGELFIVKKSPYFEILGKIEVTRGQLVVYGKKFTIKKGMLEFQGGKSINPILDISTDYVFRGTDNVSKTLTMLITNTMDNPTISYMLDGQGISESDAYSYIIFGTPMNEAGGSSSQFNIAGAVSSDMISKVVSNQLSQTIGDSFNLDIIEMSSVNNMQNVAFTVGKYVTHDLFVTYQKGFGVSSGNEVAPDQLTLEYEFNKNTFFRLQSGNSETNGVDIILKFEK